MTIAQSDPYANGDFAEKLAHYTMRLYGGRHEHSAAELRDAALHAVGECVRTQCTGPRADELRTSAMAVAAGLGVLVGGQQIDEAHPLCKSLSARRAVVSATVSLEHLLKEEIVVLVRLAMESPTGLWVFAQRQVPVTTRSPAPVDGVNAVRSAINLIAEEARTGRPQEVLSTQFALCEVDRDFVRQAGAMRTHVSDRTSAADLVIGTLGLMPAVQACGRMIMDKPKLLSTSLAALLCTAPARPAKEIEEIHGWLTSAQMFATARSVEGLAEGESKLVATGKQVSLAPWARRFSLQTGRWTWTEEGEALRKAYVGAIDATHIPGWWMTQSGANAEAPVPRPPRSKRGGPRP